MLSLNVRCSGGVDSLRWTCIVRCITTWNANFDVLVNLGIQLQNVDVAGNQELIAAFPAAIDLINNHLSGMYQLQFQHNSSLSDQTGGSSPGKVLVFCESGNERSAALVIAYIMAMYSMDLIKAIQLVQSQRFAVSIDDATRNYLETYSYILQAKRDVIRQRASALAFHANIGLNSHIDKPVTSKRALENTYDEDTDMGNDMGNDDHERFEKRNGLAPFQD